MGAHNCRKWGAFWMSFMEQKEHHVSVVTNSLNCAKADRSFFKNTDKKRVYSYESETKQQLSQWKTLSRHPRRCTKFKTKKGWHVSLFLMKKVQCTTNTLYEVKMWKKAFLFGSTKITLMQFAINSKKMGVWCMENSSWSDIGTSSPMCAAIFSQTSHSTSKATAVLTRHCPQWIFPPPPN